MNIAKKQIKLTYAWMLLAGLLGVTSLSLALAPSARAQEGPIKATYYSTRDLKGTSKTKQYTTVDYNWGYNAPIAGIGKDNWSARFESNLFVPKDGTYRIYTDSDDGVRVWIDDTLVINSWTGHKLQRDSGSIFLHKDKVHKLKVEYFDGDKGARLKLSWSLNYGFGERVIPLTAFTKNAQVVAVGGNNGQDPVSEGPLKATYYSKRDLTGNAKTLQVKNVDFNWGNKSPLSGYPTDNWSARYEGTLYAPKKGTYRFYTDSDDGVRVWINDKIVINSWTGHKLQRDSGSVFLRTGEPYKLRVEYFDGASGAQLKLSWSLNYGFSERVVPSSAFSASATNTAQTNQKTANKTAEKVPTKTATPVYGQTPGALSAASYPIKASGRYLSTADGKPFYMLADTPWLTIARLKQEEVRKLMDVRKSQGFNTLNMILLNMPHKTKNFANRYGDKPFTGTTNIDSPLTTGGNSSNPWSKEYDYWDHVDWVFNEAAKRGMQINLAPTWYGYAGEDWRSYVNNGNASAFGKFVGSRIGKHKNVMWIMGGDNNPTSSDVAKVPNGRDRSDARSRTNAMANAIRNAEPMRHLMSYHAKRKNSSIQYFGGASWHNLAYAYSDQYTYKYVNSAYKASGGRPVVVPEAFYDARTSSPKLSRTQLRSQAYWALTSGAVGFSYGHENVWDIDGKWSSGIYAQSAKDMKILANLFNTLPVNSMKPSPQLLASGSGTYNSPTYASAIVSSDKRVAAIYFPNKRSNIKVGMWAFASGTKYAEWYNPSNGARTPAGSQTSGNLTVQYPSGYSDAVLLVKVK